MKLELDHYYLFETFIVWRGEGQLSRWRGEIVNVFLVFFQVLQVFVETNLDVLARLARLETKKLSDVFLLLLVLSGHDALLQEKSVIFVEFLVVDWVFD